MVEQNNSNKMKLYKYNQFLGDKSINENLDKAKKFLKERELIKKAAQELDLIDGELAADLEHGDKRTVTIGDFSEEGQNEIRKKLRELRLTDEEVRTIERDPNFLKIREYLGTKYIGWTYPFTYFYFVEMVSLDELFTKIDPNTKEPDNILAKLIDYGGLLDRMPKRFDHSFIDPTLPPGGPGNNMEKLIDGLGFIEEYRKVKKIIDTLPSKLKSEYNKAPESMKEQLAQIAVGFDSVAAAKKEKVWKSFFGEMKLDTSPVLPDGKPNPNYNKMVWSSSLRRFESMDNPIRELIKAATNHLKACENDNILAFYEKINTCNEKYGRLGADIILDDNGILVLEVKSFQANQFLNGHTRHCIKDSMSQWQSYVANHSNKQYYFYNFNISQTDNLSVIGITIAPGKTSTAEKYKSSDGSAEIYSHGYGRACHAKNDSNVADQLKSIFQNAEGESGLDIKIFDTCLRAMTPEEIDRRERAKIAEREIIRKGLTIEQIKKYVKEDGADINKDNAKALENAVEEGDVEKAKVCLELGASPNLKKGPDAPISKASGIDMIKLLVTYGSDMTGDVFNQVMGQPDALEFCLKAGLDPSFNNFLPWRKITKGTWRSVSDIGESYYDAFLLLLKYGAKVQDDRGRNMIVKWAAEYGRMDILNYLDESGLSKKFQEKDWRESILWIAHSQKLPSEKKDEVNNYLKSKINE
jgi:hypothetical protein